MKKQVVVLAMIVLAGCRQETGEEFKGIEEALPAGECPGLTVEQASKFVQLSLQCAEKEYPNKPSNIVDGDETVLPPRELTPAFFGCFDWHSAVHGHWAMARILRLYPDLPEAAALRQVLNRHLTPELMAREARYFEGEHNSTFERPYGWGWLLRLQAELESWDSQEALRWRGAVEPLAALLAGRMADYLARLSFPIRVGTHANTAFALVHAWDYAVIKGNRALLDAIRANARRFYLADTDCPTVYEPSGEDFISPCLAEADLMVRVLPADEFGSWFARFMPAREQLLASLLVPPEIRDPEDPKIGHLVGLDFQRAWALRGVARVLPETHGLRALFEKSATAHCAVGTGLVFESGYGGAHWLASFAIYLLTEGR